MGGASGYVWSLMYLLTIVYSMTEGKRLMSRVKFDAPIWGSVLYTNLLCLPGMLAIAIISGEFTQLPTASGDLSLPGYLWLVSSIIVGTGISWAGWNCREKISATSYTLVGVVCKFITVFLNLVVSRDHASPMGVFWLLVCIASSTLYQQAPLRKLTAPA